MWDGPANQNIDEIRKEINSELLKHPSNDLGSIAFQRKCADTHRNIY